MYLGSKKNIDPNYGFPKKKIIVIGWLIDSTYHKM
jgi:hypothetical protein